MSDTARVALDQLLQLGDGSRDGAVAVLAALWRTEPELMGAGLGLALQTEDDLSRLPLPIRDATHTAGRWRELGPDWVRTDLARSDRVGEVFVNVGTERTHYHARVYRWRMERRELYTLDIHDTLEEAQAEVDHHLAEMLTTDRQWRLL